MFFFVIFSGAEAIVVSFFQLKMLFSHEIERWGIMPRMGGQTPRY